MNNYRNASIISAAVLIIATSLVVVRIFNTKFAKVTIDYFAFLAAIFLIIDALFKIISENDKFFPCQLIRFTRLIIGVSIFTVHMLQYIYGI